MLLAAALPSWGIVPVTPAAEGDVRHDH